MTSKTTRNYHILSFVFGLLSLLCIIGPFLYYGGVALAGGALVVEKAALVASVLVVGIMTAVAAVNKVALRSRIWIVLFALFLCLDNFLVPLIVVGGCQIADELIINPLYKHFAAKASINAEIDKRN